MRSIARSGVSPGGARSDGHHWCQAARTVATCTGLEVERAVMGQRCQPQSFGEVQRCYPLYFVPHTQYSCSWASELCHHRPRSKAHSNEYENNADKAEQSLPAWRGAGRSSRGTKPLLSSSDGARSCRIRLPRDLWTSW